MISTTTHAAVEMISAIFRPDDIVEIRSFTDGKPGERAYPQWLRAGEAEQVVGYLQKMSDAGYSLHFGVNTRRARGASGNDGALLGRCMVADFDGKAIDEALGIVSAANLPTPSIRVRTSQRGTHVYWLVSEPFEDMFVWANRQADLISLLGSDPNIKKPDQMLRLPGFPNRKYDPAFLVELVECSDDLIYETSDLLSLIPRRPGSSDEYDDDQQPREYTDADLAVAADALQHADARRADDYCDWITAGLALHNVGKASAEAYGVWLRFSRQSDKFSDRLCTLKWASFNKSMTRVTPNKVGLRRLLHWAQEDSGWQPVRAMGSAWEVADAPTQVAQAAQKIDIETGEVVTAAAVTMLPLRRHRNRAWRSA